MIKRKKSSLGKISLWAIIALIIILVGGGFLLKNALKKGKAGKPIVNVAFNIPLTGPFGIYGQTVRDGALLALEDLKSQNLPFELKLDIEDNTGSPGKTVNIMRKQFMGKVDIYSSGVKPQTMAIFDEVVKKGVPYFVWIFDAFICRNHPSVFRTWVSYKYEPEKYLEYIAYKKAKKLAIIYVNLPHAEEEFYKILIPKAKEKFGITDSDILIESYHWELKDFKNIFLKVQKFNPDLIILNGFQENLVGMIKALRSYNMIKDGNVIATYDMLDAANLLTNEEKEGVRVIAPRFNTRHTEIIENWKKTFKAKYGRDPLYTDAYAYDMIMIIADAAKRLPHLPAKSQEWISALKATDIQGITGRLRFDEDGDQIIELDIGVYKDGKLVPDEIELKKEGQ